MLLTFHVFQSNFKALISLLACYTCSKLDEKFKVSNRFFWALGILFGNFQLLCKRTECKNRTQCSTAVCSNSTGSSENINVWYSDDENLSYDYKLVLRDLKNVLTESGKKA